MSAYHLAELNIARLLAPIDSPELADFVANLERINALAEQQDGYVWRLQSDQGDATGYTMFDEQTIPNLTVWKSIESLHHYVYKSAHVDIMKRRKEWFAPMKEAFMVLWWIPAGHIPSLQEAQEKLELLRAKGPTAEAFTFRKHFPAPTILHSASVKSEKLSSREQSWSSLDGECPA